MIEGMRAGGSAHTAQPDGDAREQLNEVETRVGDLAVVAGIGVGRAAVAQPVDRIVERHLHIVDAALSIHNLVTKVKGFPPGGQRCRHRYSPSPSVQGPSSN